MIRLAVFAAVLASGCGYLESPEVAVARCAAELEARLPRQGPLALTKLRIEPPKLAHGERGEMLVNALVWAEGTAGGAKLIFHGGETLPMARARWGRWVLGDQLQRLQAVTSALLRRKPPAPVAQWAVGLTDAAGGEGREEYARDVNARPVRAATRLALARDRDGRWSVTER